MPVSSYKDCDRHYSAYRQRERYHLQRQTYHDNNDPPIDYTRDADRRYRHRSSKHSSDRRSKPVVVTRYSPGSDRADWPRHTLPGAYERQLLDRRYTELKDMVSSIRGRSQKFVARKEAFTRMRKGRHTLDPSVVRERDRLVELKKDLLELKSAFERKAVRLQKDYVAFSDKLRRESRYGDRRVSSGCKEAEKIARAVDVVKQLVGESCGILKRR
ncbi:hypothetical protein K431DRAFT_290993 [Polychaeton citri CBS 116435]|uniref:Uncharacterized protein n=1 Tax=Polychaeton citri CBS 116435 TaxID=1314669 RepID=A0A9P4QGE0_9PEZI|nr:hypothetical protein K431DRAFT_290993 [Polychaeton citri CBS 116435]